MFLRLLTNSIRRRKVRKLLAVGGVWIGLTLVTALLTLSVDIGDRINRELQAFGANIRVEPIGASLALDVGGHRVAGGLNDGADLAEADVEGLKDDFWRNQFLAIAPRLTVAAHIEDREVALIGTWFDHGFSSSDGEQFVMGARETYPHWSVRGAWPQEGRAPGCLVGAELARQLDATIGDSLLLEAATGELSLTISGIVATGGDDDLAVFAPLEAVQRFRGIGGRVHTVDVAAMTTRENELHRRYQKDPASLTPEEYERWYCTPYPGVVAAGIQDRIDGSAARVVRRVTETQGAALGRIEGLVLWLSAIGALACVLGVGAVLSASILERRHEVALLQAVGAKRGDVAALFLAESCLLGLIGGLLATATGVLLGSWLVGAVFGVRAEPGPLVLALAPVLGVLLACGATVRPVWQALGSSTAATLAEG